MSAFFLDDPQPSVQWVLGKTKTRRKEQCSTRTEFGGVFRIEDPPDLAEKLSAYSQVLCSAFETAGGTIWACDSTSEDAIQEYGVLRPDGDHYRQVESITVSWCDAAKLERFILEVDQGLQ